MRLLSFAELESFSNFLRYWKKSELSVRAVKIIHRLRCEKNFKKSRISEKMKILQIRG
jgi:hypothetical protein